MTGPLRVLTVTNIWPTGGAFRGIFVKEQVEALRALGHHVDVEIVAQERGRRDYFLAAPRVRRRVRAGSYDVVHIHFGMTALAARFVGRVPRVLTLHGGDVHIWWQRWLTRLGWGGVAEKIYASARLARDAGVDPATTSVIACGLDTSVFTPQPQAAARAYARHRARRADRPVRSGRGQPGQGLRRVHRRAGRRCAHGACRCTR